MNVANVVAQLFPDSTVPAGLLIGLDGLPDRASFGPGPLLLPGRRVVIMVPRDARLALEEQSSELFSAAHASGCVLVLYDIEQPTAYMDIVLRACDEGLAVMSSRYAVPAALQAAR